MKRIYIRIVFTLICTCALVLQAQGRQLTPVGQVVGLELRNGSVVVASFEEELGVGSKEAGLQVGDEIREIDGMRIRSAEDVKKALDRSDGAVTVLLSRNGKQQQLLLQPQITKNGPKLGVYLRQGVTGIGTVTWYDPDNGAFGTLGHGVNDSGGKLLAMTEGNAYDARVLAVRKGKVGEPGQLMGAVERLEPAGELTKNTPQGVFGISKQGWEGKEFPVADASQVRAGKATILSTVSGTEPREYSVEILKIYPKSRQTGRNMLIRVTDSELLEITGGIVQGMSGSPIIQNGKLIGAVTHVLVNDPTTGYGIFIENMLDAAG